MKRIIIDASISLSFYLKDEINEYSTTLLNSLAHFNIIVPPHWFAEITNGLLMAERRKRVSIQELDQIMLSLIAFEPEIIEISPEDYLQKVIPLAHNYKLTSYDACYLHLAISKKAPLATLDKALRQAASKAGALVFK